MPCSITASEILSQPRTPLVMSFNPSGPRALRRPRVGVDRLEVGEVVLPGLEEDVLVRFLPRCHKFQPRRELLTARQADAVAEGHGGEPVPFAV
eukprot:1982350-Prymnesium_polylepis.2